MLAQILYQVAGQPDSGVSHYSDVPDDSWCYAAVSWVSETGIMDGSNGNFNPDRAPARQELAEPRAASAERRTGHPEPGRSFHL